MLIPPLGRELNLLNVLGTKRSLRFAWLPEFHGRTRNIAARKLVLGLMLAGHSVLTADGDELPWQPARKALI